MSKPEKKHKGQYRYPGAQPFTRNQQNIFFGREKDIEGLYQLMSVEQLVVLYSKSGLGKSSLLNAGLIPKIEEEGLYEPITFRFGAYMEGKKETPIGISQQTLGKNIKSDSFLEKVVKDKNSLWYQLKNRWLHAKNKKGYILIFDQFEELFTYPKEAIRDFKLQLVEALNSTIPQEIRKQVEKEFAKNPGFLSADEYELMATPIRLKVIMGIRSDRMSLIAQLADYLPNILSNCYELGALTAEQAEDAILSPAYLKSSDFIAPVFDYTDETIEAILAFLTKENKDKIESFQLQILCQTLERKVIQQKIKLITRADLGDIENVYKNYYDNQLKLIGNDDEEYAARVLIEDGLIFEEEERRLNIYEGQVHKAFNITPALLAKLVDSHLLRAEPSMKGGYTYELSHDTLVAPVLRSKRKRKAEEARLEKERIEKEKEAEMEALRKEAAKEKKRRNLATLAAITGFLLFGLALTATNVAYSYYLDAKKATLTAQEKEEEAKRSLELLTEEQTQKSEAQFSAFMEKGKALIANSDYIAAGREFQNALDIDGKENNAEALRMKEECENNSGKKQRFEEHIKKGDSFYNGGSSKYVNALEEYREARSLNYNNNLADSKINNVSGKLEAAYNGFISDGDKFFKAKGYKYALDNYKKALRIKPNDSSLKKRINECKQKM